MTRTPAQSDGGSGLQRERTRLAWHRTFLAAAVCLTLLAWGTLVAPERHWPTLAVSLPTLGVLGIVGLRRTRRLRRPDEQAPGAAPADHLRLLDVSVAVLAAVHTIGLCIPS